jgi:hypothetical protein
MREGFPACTVLTVAHRTNTVTDSDMVVVSAALAACLPYNLSNALEKCTGRRVLAM